MEKKTLTNWLNEDKEPKEIDKVDSDFILKFKEEAQIEKPVVSKPKSKLKVSDAVIYLPVMIAVAIYGILTMLSYTYNTGFIKLLSDFNLVNVIPEVTHDINRLVTLFKVAEMKNYFILFAIVWLLLTYGLRMMLTKGEDNNGQRQDK